MSPRPWPNVRNDAEECESKIRQEKILDKKKAADGIKGLQKAHRSLFCEAAGAPMIIEIRDWKNNRGSLSYHDSSLGFELSLEFKSLVD